MSHAEKPTVVKCRQEFVPPIACGAGPCDDGVSPHCDRVFMGDDYFSANGFSGTNLTLIERFAVKQHGNDMYIHQRNKMAV